MIRTLGLDIGTTKVAAVIADSESREVLDSSSLVHRADVSVPGIPGASEQSVSVILNVLADCIGQLDQDLLQQVEAVGLTGQMHGVVLFSPGKQETSNLYTWQDERCVHKGFLEKLQKASGDNRLRSGYGVATMAWLSEYEPEFIGRYRSASTIHAYIGALLAGTNRALIDPTDAASLGLFDIRTNTWLKEKIASCGVDISKLPTVVASDTIIGHVSKTWAEKLRIPAGIPVLASIGDNQASLYGSLDNPREQIALTIGTGAQVSIVCDELPEALPGSEDSYEFRPYLEGNYIVVGASLSGGRALAAFAKGIEDFLRVLEVSPAPRLEEIYSTLLRMGNDKLQTSLIAETSFAGERHDLALRGSLSNVSFENFGFGDIFAALSLGLVRSLYGMLPENYYSERTVVVGSGNAIRRSPIIQKFIEQLFKRSLILTSGSETTCSGAAFFAGDIALKKTRKI